MSRPSRFLLAATAVAAFCLSGIASAQRFYDPPGRVARISDMRGYVSYSPAGDGEWYDAHRNRPLVRGDALWSDRGALADRRGPRRRPRRAAGRQHLAAHGR